MKILSNIKKTLDNTKKMQWMTKRNKFKPKLIFLIKMKKNLISLELLEEMVETFLG